MVVVNKKRELSLGNIRGMFNEIFDSLCVMRDDLYYVTLNADWSDSKVVEMMESVYAYMESIDMLIEQSDEMAFYFNKVGKVKTLDEYTGRDDEK